MRDFAAGPRVYSRGSCDPFCPPARQSFQDSLQIRRATHKSNDDKIFLLLSAPARITLIENFFNNIDYVFVLCASKSAMEEEERVDGVCGARVGARSGVGVDIDEEAAYQEGLFSKLHYCGMEGVVKTIFEKITSMGTYKYVQLIAANCILDTVPAALVMCTLTRIRGNCDQMM